MLNLNEKEKEFIRSNLDDAENILKSDKLNDILLPLDDWLTANGFDEEYALTDKGREIQRMYDNIYLNN